MTKDEALKLALEAAYLAGWNASGEGYNAEHPFRDDAKNPEEDVVWLKDRDNALREALAQPEQAAQQEPVAVVSGYYGGQCVILPIDPARIFNSNTALYTKDQL